MQPRKLATLGGCQNNKPKNFTENQKKGRRSTIARHPWRVSVPPPRRPTPSSLACLAIVGLLPGARDNGVGRRGGGTLALRRHSANTQSLSQHTSCTT